VLRIGKGILCVKGNLSQWEFITGEFITTCCVEKGGVFREEGHDDSGIVSIICGDGELGDWAFPEGLLKRTCTDVAEHLNSVASAFPVACREVSERMMNDDVP